ncbi:hypothetical protein C6341_g4854 [Phytophthora cactorum]|nr:hypothetical protein C6341_g4854 [Phytophthora cactorum]
MRDSAPDQLRRVGASARSRSKPARGTREAGPRGICVGGPSAELTSDPRIALSSTFDLYIAREANRGGAEGALSQASGWFPVLHASLSMGRPDPRTIRKNVTKSPYPPSVDGTISDRFGNDPQYASVPDEPASTDASPTGDEDGNGNADGNDHSDLAALLNSIGRTENPSPPTSPRQEHSAQDSPAIDHDSHAKILAAIANEPSLVRFYLQLSQPQATKRLANGQSKHAFARSRTQRLIHSTISAPEYTGKLPSAVVDAMISSRSTKFKPHPAIIARVFDIQFGARGLSVMHLTRFDFAAR